MSEARTLPEKIAGRLRRDILCGKLLPGDSIKERDNAQELGVSRTPMREAVRILAKEGLVVLRPARSPIVARPSAKDVSDQVEVLLALEKLSVDLACQHATEAEIASIAGIAEAMAERYESAAPVDMFEIDMSFHTAIAQASHNAALAETHQSFLARLWRARFVAARQRRSRERAVDQHFAILRALQARDAAAGRKAIEAHLWRLAEDIRGVIETEERQRQRAE